MSHTPGPWMISDVRGKIGQDEFHKIIRYDESLKTDEDIAAVWFVPETGVGLADAYLIKAAPDLLEALVVVTANLEALIVVTANLMEASYLYSREYKKSAPHDEAFDIRIRNYQQAIDQAREAIGKARGEGK